MSVQTAAEAQVLSLWRVGPGAAMLLARSRDRLAASGTVVGAGGARGVFRRFEAPPGGEERLTLLAVRLAGQADLAAGGGLALRFAGGAAVRVTLPGEATGDAAFGQQAARAAGGHGAGMARFMLDVLRPSGGREAPHVETMLRAFLSAAAQGDGCIEIMAPAPGACVSLQGWGAEIEGAVQVVLAGRALGIFPGYAGGFARGDIAAPATGVMLVLPPEAATALAGIDHVFVLSEHGLHGRTLVEHRVLDAASSVGHIRHMLPGLRGPTAMLAALREAVRPRYEAVDTLGGDAHPVRAAVDTAVAAEGVGAYLSGWVFDPLRLIAGLHLCGPGGRSARLDQRWTRVPRADVCEAFRGQAGFPAASDANAGFAVFVEEGSGADGWHLQFTFRDGERAFMPLSMADPGEAAVRSALLASVDLYKPSGLTIVERHVGPLMARARPRSGGARVALQGPTGRADAVVVPLETVCLPRAMLSSFLHDPAGKTEQAVFVCGPSWGQGPLDSLRALAEFYGLAATILVTEEADGAIGALRAAARACGAERLLLAQPSVAGRRVGWRRALRRALAERAEAAFACPTVLYEDWSIRWAGSSDLRFTDMAPWAEARTERAGLPGALATGEAAAAAMGTLECCLLGPTAMAALEGDGAWATEAGREAAFFMRLKALGLSGVWAPGVQVYAAEEAAEGWAEGGPSAGRVARLADGWALRERWRDGAGRQDEAIRARAGGEAAGRGRATGRSVRANTLEMAREG